MEKETQSKFPSTSSYFQSTEEHVASPTAASNPQNINDDRTAFQSMWTWNQWSFPTPLESRVRSPDASPESPDLIRTLAQDMAIAPTNRQIFTDSHEEYPPSTSESQSIFDASDSSLFPAPTALGINDSIRRQLNFEPSINTHTSSVGAILTAPKFLPASASSGSSRDDLGLWDADELAFMTTRPKQIRRYPQQPMYASYPRPSVSTQLRQSVVASTDPSTQLLHFQSQESAYPPPIKGGTVHTARQQGRGYSTNSKSSKPLQQQAGFLSNRRGPFVESQIAEDLSLPRPVRSSSPPVYPSITDEGLRTNKSLSKGNHSMQSIAFSGEMKRKDTAFGSAVLAQQQSMSSSFERDRLQSARIDVEESAETKSLVKEYGKQIRIMEKESLESAKEYALQAIHWIPSTSVWRVKLDLADIYKRMNVVDAARALYSSLCQDQPRAIQSWLEWSKLEEEAGDHLQALQVLQIGLYFNPTHETIMGRILKLLERLHLVSTARCMLSALVNEHPQSVWRTIFEGALMEARIGRVDISRRIFRDYLMPSVQWYGPVYYEAFRIEEKSGNFAAALKIANIGLLALSKYGPLWFGLLRLFEKLDVLDFRSRYSTKRLSAVLPRMRWLVKQAIEFISKELVWKVYFEMALAEERAIALIMERQFEFDHEISVKDISQQLLKSARRDLLKAAFYCPLNLRWKVWLAGARLELSASRLSACRGLLLRALAEAPSKSRAQVLIDCARVEAFVGNTTAARAVLSRSMIEFPHDWKLALESVLLEIRAGNLKAAAERAQIALQSHPGTGRLWAIFVQIAHRRDCQMGQAIQLVDGTAAESMGVVSALERAFLDVPKSGEVWCECARAHLNPFHASRFDLRKAQRALKFAIMFTPQYGDSFLEYVKLEILCQVMLPYLLALLGISTERFIGLVLHDDEDSDIACLSIPAMSHPCMPVDGIEFIGYWMSQIECLRLEDLELDAKISSLKFDQLERRCANADPNYGAVWFFSRRSPINTPSTVLSLARSSIASDLISAQSVYFRALLHFVCRQLIRIQTEPQHFDQSADYTSAVLGECKEVFSMSPFNESKDNIGFVLENEQERSNLSFGCTSPLVVDCNGQWLCAADALTAVEAYNRLAYHRGAPDSQLQEALFGADEILP